MSFQNNTRHLWLGSSISPQVGQSLLSSSQLAYDAGRMGGTMTAVLNAANEAANEMFREDVGLGFLDIPKLIEGAMETH